MPLSPTRSSYPPSALSLEVRFTHWTINVLSCYFTILHCASSLRDFAATADSMWTVGCVLEKKLLPLPFTLALSGIFNHTKQQSKVGVGLIIG